MKKLLLLIPALTIFGGFQTYAHSGPDGHSHGHEHAMEEQAKEKITVSQMYSFATTSVQKNGAAFMKITNNTDEDISVVRAQTDISERIELHTMSMENDVMRMRKVENFEIKAGETFELKPSGNHIMLMGLKEALTDESDYTLTLMFDNGETQDVTVEVVIPGTTPGHDHHGHMHSHDDGMQHDHDHAEDDKDHKHDHEKKHDESHDHDHSHH